jgi:hypothetical protein
LKDFSFQKVSFEKYHFICALLGQSQEIQKLIRSESSTVCAHDLTRSKLNRQQGGEQWRDIIVALMHSLERNSALKQVFDVNIMETLVRDLVTHRAKFII